MVFARASDTQKWQVRLRVLADNKLFVTSIFPQYRANRGHGCFLRNGIDERYGRWPDVVVREVNRYGNRGEGDIAKPPQKQDSRRREVSFL